MHKVEKPKENPTPALQHNSKQDELDIAIDFGHLLFSDLVRPP